MPTYVHMYKFHLPCIIRSPKLAYLNCILKLLTNFFVRLNFITCWKARALTSLQLRNLAFNILGLLCKSQLRFDSCDITFTSTNIDWLINWCIRNYVCLCLPIYAYLNASLCVLIYIRIHRYLCINTYIGMVCHLDMHTLMHIQCIHKHTYIHMHKYMSIHTYICMH